MSTVPLSARGLPYHSASDVPGSTHVALLDRVLCCRYVWAGFVVISPASAGNADVSGWRWGLALHATGQYEVLGAWPAPLPLHNVLQGLHARGLVEVQCLSLGNTSAIGPLKLSWREEPIEAESSGSGFRDAFPGAVLPADVRRDCEARLRSMTAALLRRPWRKRAALKVSEPVSQFLLRLAALDRRLQWPIAGRSPAHAKRQPL